MTALATRTPSIDDASNLPARERMTQRQLVGLAHHYQDLARRDPDDEHFWLSRALYYGRLSWRSRELITARERS
jgi:hypothetical protein